ncbi:MAG: radical SAM family heme chaperone HemW [Coriobacteriia bacterium]
MTERAPGTALPVSLYVHVPFCRAKCAYCDFHSVPGSQEEFVPFVESALRRVDELAAAGRAGLLTDVPTLYVGGGTPTVLGESLVVLVRGLREQIGLRDDAEVTVEANPDSCGPALVAALVDAGVTRISLGVQSFDDAVLRTLGRPHSAARASAAARVLDSADVRFSLDLICGVPGQTFASWDETLERAVASGARHISVYPLTVEEGTPLAAAIASGEAPAPDPDVAADMMLAAEVALAASGLPRYEVANYAASRYQSCHNIVYWTGGAYLGAGPSAASMLPLETYRAAGLDVVAGIPVDASGGRVRFVLEGPSPGGEYLAPDDAAREDVMLRLRMTAGVSTSQVDAAGLKATLEELRERGLVEVHAGADGPRWRTTQQGWLLGNEVFGAVWTV